MLMDMDCCDIIQPDVGWCGGVTELIKIANYADSKGVMMVPHGSSVYSYHFVITRHNSPFAEFLMMHPGPTEVRSEEHTSELQSLMRISYAVFCLKTKKKKKAQ